METEALIERCALDRNYFARAVLGFDPDPWQGELFSDMDGGETRLSVRSGHGVGKTAACAILAIHFLLFRPGTVKVIITSPSSSQLHDGLWSEMLVWIDRLPHFLQEMLEVKNKRIVDRLMPDARFISLRTARIENPEAIAGIHGDNVLLLVDEASGVPEAIFEAGAGTLSTEGAIAVLIGNPTRTSGMFYRTHNKLSDHWRTYQVSCLDSPRVSAAFVDDIRRTYGEQSAQWKIRILGEFADENEDVIIPRILAEGALGRDVVSDGKVYWGVDPGRGGDPTGFIARQGRKIVHIEEFHLNDLMAVVGRVHEHWEGAHERPEAVFVDVIGLGAGVADRLRELGLPVVDVNVSELPALKQRYPRLRDEIWFECRSWFESRVVHIPPTEAGEALVEELVSPLAVINPTTGKTAAESKKDMKRRGVKSPNLADALCLTFAFGGAAAAGLTKNSGWGMPLERGLAGIA